jgi:uncharacterized SAM-binding protein YcdF (DUF218 family)
MRATAFGLALVAAGCGEAARDVLRPYAPRASDIEAVLALPPPAHTVDAAIVLGCPALPDGTPSPCEMCRIDAAVRLYAEGRARNFIFSGGAAHSPHVEADVMADAARTRGVPETIIRREGRALTTWQNLRFALKLARAEKWSTFLLVSTADHLPRARRIAQFYGLDDAHTGYVACDAPAPPT